MKLVAPLYYIGKVGSGNIALLRFGNASFFAKRGTVDAIPLQEIWGFNCYDNASLRQGDIVVDIGAHIGGYSVKAAKQCAKVIAYEASPSNYELLVKNLAINGCHNVKAYNAAVASKNGTVKLFLDPKGTALNSIYHAPSSGEKITVNSVNLHTVFTRNKLKMIDVLKLDVEGAEYDILLHARAADLRKIRTIVMEYHDFLDHCHNKNELKALLISNGFSVKETSPWFVPLFLKKGELFATRNKP